MWSMKTQRKKSDLRMLCFLPVLIHLVRYNDNLLLMPKFQALSMKLVTSRTGLSKYRISRSIRHTFFPQKCDINSTCILCAEGKYYFQTYKYLYIFYMKKVTHRVKTTMKMILVAVTTIFWISMMNKLYYGC